MQKFICVTIVSSSLKTHEFQEQVLKLFIELTPAALTSFTQPTSMRHGEYLLLSDLGRKIIQI